MSSDPSRPAWEKTLLALDRAVSDSTAQAAGVEVVWRLGFEDDDRLEVAPWVRRVGTKASPTRMHRRRLQLEHGSKLEPQDARLVALMPERGTTATRELMEALVDHPRVVLAEQPTRSVRIERVKVGIVAEDRRGTVRLYFGIEGAALPYGVVERIRWARNEEPVFVWEEGAARLSLLDVKPALRAIVEVLQREGAVFPPESHGALVTALARWAQVVPVAMPRSVMGEAVPSELQLVLRMQAEPDESVLVELLVRPLPESGDLVPGQGARDVHVRRAGRALHAVRELRQEEEAAERLVARLKLDEGEPLDRPFSFRLAGAEEALALVERCATDPDAPHVAWIGAAVVSLGAPSPQALKVAVTEKRDWFGVLGGLSVAGERVELARLLDATRRKQRFVKVVASTYIEVTGLLRRHLEALADHVRSSKTGLELGPASIPALSAIERAGATLDTDDAWRALQARIEAAEALVPVVPTTLHAQLRPYQREGFEWLARIAAWGAGGVLADDMGLGKTLQALALLLDRAEDGPALVVAPTSVAFNWKDEAARFAPTLNVVLYAGASDRDQVLRTVGPGDVVVVSYGLLVRDAKKLCARAFGTVVFDEAQLLKNATTQRARVARLLRAGCKVALSGTPLENHLGELWSLFSIVFPRLLGSWEAFRVRYAAPIERGADDGSAASLARLLRPFLLRRTKAQVEADLPPRTEIRVPVVLSTAEWALYEDARLAALSDLETRASVMREQERRVEVLAALTRLRLLASHPRLYDEASEVESAKLQRLMELLDELRAEGQRALVFSQFTSHLAIVRDALLARGIAPLYLDGRTPARMRKDIVDEFQRGDVPFFLVSLKAGGFGLNLTAATNVIHLDPWWNPATEDQASDRTHRIGQTKPVTIYRLVALGTIEERMLSLHAQKRALADAVLAGSDRAGTVPISELIAMLGPGDARG